MFTVKNKNLQKIVHQKTAKILSTCLMQFSQLGVTKRSPIGRKSAKSGNPGHTPSGIEPSEQYAKW